jgi:putative colanic acid biosynthesis UDP-glucose lipid carrier transferase
MDMFINKKPNQYSKAFYVILVALDVLITLLVFGQAGDFLSSSLLYDLNQIYTFGFAWLLLWIIISFFSDGYEVSQHRTLNRTIRNTFKIALLHLPFAGGVAYLISLNQISFADLTTLYGLFIAFTLLIKSVLLFAYLFIRNLEKNKNKVVILGYTKAGINLYKHFNEDKSSGYSFAGFFDNNVKHNLVLGDIHKMKKYCIRENVNEIFFALPYDKELVKDISSFADDNFIRLAILQDIGTKELNPIHSMVYDDNLPVLSLKASRRSRPALEKRHQRALSVIKNLNL